MMSICRGLLAPALLVPMLSLAIAANAQQSPGVFQLQHFGASLPVLVIPEDSASALRPAVSESLGQ